MGLLYPHSQSPPRRPTRLARRPLFRAQTSALRGALASLFALPQLPDNPYYFLAQSLSAYLDQSDLWRASDAEIVGPYDLEGGVEVVEPATRACQLGAGEADAIGLPHVMRLVSRDGALSAARSGGPGCRGGRAAAGGPPTDCGSHPPVPATRRVFSLRL